jgi:hypothetical protein
MRCNELPALQERPSRLPPRVPEARLEETRSCTSVQGTAKERNAGELGDRRAKDGRVLMVLAQGNARSLRYKNCGYAGC